MWPWIGSLSLGIAAALALGGGRPREALAPRTEQPQAATPTKPKVTKGAWVTQQSIQLLAWDPQMMRLMGLMLGGGLGVAWGLLVHNPVDGGLMGIIGYQIPGFAAEVRAARLLGARMHQISLFVGTFADRLETGAPVPQALDTAARAITTPPLRAEADLLLRRLAGGTDVGRALTAMGERIQLPMWDLFVDLVILSQRVGGNALLFRDLDWQLQELERIQQEFRTLTQVYMVIVGILFGVSIIAIPAQAVGDPALWHYVSTHLAFIPLAGSGLAVLVFGGIRRYARMRVML